MTARSTSPVGHSSETVGYSWDSAGISGSYGVGRLASITDATGTTSFAYDHRGNLITRRQTVGSGTADLAYAYDLADRVTQITYPSGRIVAYSRDSKGRVTQVSTKASASDPSWATLASAITYEPWGSVTGAQLGNGLTLTQSWSDGRLSAKRLTNSATSTDLSWLAYHYDPNDNIGAIRDQLDDTKSVYYGYDASDRLTLTSWVSGSTPAPETYSYTSGTNRLASVTTASGTRSITYDNRGNTATETRPGSVSVAASYDGYGRLLTYARTGDPSQSNAYNGLDERVAATSGSTTRAYVYDQHGRLLGEYGTSAADVVAETIWLLPEAANDNQPFGGDDGIGGYAPLAVVTGSGTGVATNWVHGNHMGVPLLHTDASGAAVTPAAHTLPGFPGQMRTLADLYYNRHRDYDSSTGRYIQADPIGLQGDPNPYLYANANPLRFMDSEGLQDSSTERAIERRIRPKHRHDEHCEHEPPPPDWCGNKNFNAWEGTWAQACKSHDKCYSTLGVSKSTCDKNLRRDVLNQCYSSSRAIGTCAIISQTYYIAVVRGGGGSYAEGQREALRRPRR